MTDRLKWEKDGTGGFRAEIEGGRASITRDTSTGGWLWLVSIGKASASNITRSKQNASDDANAALPHVRAQAAQLRAEGERRQKLLAKIDEVMVAPDPDVVSIFSIAAADKENLSWLMNQVRDRRRTPGLNKLISALSDELYKFRTGKRR